MKRFPNRTPQMRQAGNARVLLLIFLGVVIAAGAAWYFLAAKPTGTESTSEAEQPAINLSDSTKTVLAHLKSPVDVHFYSLLDAASIPAEVQAFAGRVDRLLATYEQEGNGRIKVTRYNSRPDIDAAAAAAEADGFKPFNLDKGSACYFGLAVAQDGRRESLPQPAPEWEQALEPDLTRAIQRVATPPPAAPLTAAKAAENLTLMEEVKSLVPNFATLSVAEGTRILHEAALNDFKTTSAAMEIQIKAAEARVNQVQTNATPAEQAAALKQLQDARAEQADQLKQIAARSAARIEALQQLKETIP